MITNGQRIVTKGRIADLSPLAAENGFVRPGPHLINVSFGSHKSAPKFDRFNYFWRKPQQKLPVLFNGANNPKIAPSSREYRPVHVKHGSYGSLKSAPKRNLDRFSHFCVYRNKDSPCFSIRLTTPKIGSSPWGSGLYSNALD